MFQRFILYLKYLSYKKYFRNLAKSYFSKTTFDETFKHDIYKLKKIIKKINLSSNNFKVLDIRAHHGFFFKKYFTYKVMRKYLTPPSIQS